MPDSMPLQSASIEAQRFSRPRNIADLQVKPEGPRGHHTRSATPDRTRPHGVGNIASMSTATSMSSEESAAFSSDAAAKNPDGPEPTIAR
jgi:hypothetical protein